VSYNCDSYPPVFELMPNTVQPNVGCFPQW